AHYCAQGYCPVPVAFRTKKPEVAEWTSLRLDTIDLDQHFNHRVPHNIGLLLGVPSGGLVDVDLDCVQAVRAAPYCLPPMSSVSGRHSSPRSHYWYVVDDPPEKVSEGYSDPTDSAVKLLELRSTGGQTIVPPSVHESNEPIIWHEEGDPGRVAI